MPIPLLALLALGAAGTAGAGAAIGAARRSGKKRNPLEEDAEARVIDQPNDGALMSALNYLGHLDKAKNNLLMGNFEGVGRQAVDFLGDTVDAVLPGDWIPSISRRMDKPEFSDVVGGMEPGVGKFAVDVLGGVATDPLSFAPVGKIASGIGAAAGKAGSLAEKAALALPEGEALVQGVKKTAAATGRKVRATFGAQRLSPETRAILDRARAARTNETQAGLAAAKGSVLSGMSEDELNIVGDIIDNRLWEGDKLVGSLADDATSSVDRVALHPGVTPDNTERIRQAVQDALTIGQNQAKRPGIFKRPSMYVDAAGKRIPVGDLRSQYEEFLKLQGKNDAKLLGNVEDAKGALEDAADDYRKVYKYDAGVKHIFRADDAYLRAKKDLGEAEWFAKNVAPPEEFAEWAKSKGYARREFGIDEIQPEYLQRIYSGQNEEELAEAALARPSAVKGRKIQTLEDQQDFLSQNPGVKYERNALKRLSSRAEQQGVLSQRAEIGKAILGDGFAYADDEMRSLVTKTIEGMPPEEAQVLLDAFKGIGSRKKPMEWLATANRLFKPAAVYGAFLPKVGSIVRNRLSGTWQAASTPEARAVLKQRGFLGEAKSIGSDLADAFTQAFGPTRLKTGELSDALVAIDKAFKASGGLAENAMASLEKAGRADLAGAMRAGVLDGFVTSEDLVKEMAKNKWTKRYGNIQNWPGRIFKGVEDRMRLGMALDLMKSGKSAEDAARVVRDTFFDYAISSAENRAARDIIPFFQFQAKAIPQQAKFLAEVPAVPSALEKALGSDDGSPVYPYMEGRLNIPLGGQDEAGNQSYLTGFGLPFEALNQIPTSPREFKRNIVGSTTPILKTGLSAVFGEDPYFETPVGSYDKMPLLGSQGDLGRAYNAVLGTGLIQPFDSPLRQVDKALDDRRGVGARALDLLTGASVVSVDPDRALQQQLQESLKQSPDVQQYRGFFSRSGDEQTKALLEAHNAAKAKVKAKRAAALEAAPAAPGADPGSI